MSKPEFVEINLEPLYQYGTQQASEKMLEAILNQYEALEYVVLYSASPDIDVIYHSEEFREYVDSCAEDKDLDFDLDACALEYAEKHGYEKVVKLFDGYECAVAVVRER
ncbi:MAG: hypothetical protein JHC26_03275 [Thermofilum sp.]|jgi:hypothetical protein|uniref:hypothetical protein n=1 Tax=Thermofilum sp. TaxID=1961369 RepID=UPI00258DC950|nr:hypothetical protein [Thermofilum sp.]MCI4408090.1 hypothetical protein [Thermofilum sp.]